MWFFREVLLTIIKSMYNNLAFPHNGSIRRNDEYLETYSGTNMDCALVWRCFFYLSVCTNSPFSQKRSRTSKSWTVYYFSDETEKEVSHHSTAYHWTVITNEVSGGISALVFFKTKNNTKTRVNRVFYNSHKWNIFIILCNVLFISFLRNKKKVNSRFVPSMSM